MRIYSRDKYLKKIRGFYHDTGIIKILTGIRRCGKSCLMQTIANEIESTGVSKDNIIYLNLDKRGYKSIKTADALENIIDKLCKSKKTNYLFIDEIQNVDGFEDVINAYREEDNYSIFITGSNSYLLSGELVTKLTGRYIEFEIFPLTFDEYLEMKAFKKQQVDDDINKEFENYIIEGGFPKALDYESIQDKRTYIRSIVGEIFEKDIRKRIKIRNVEAFNKIQNYIINNFGATTNLSNILKEVNKLGYCITRETLNKYIQALVDAKIIHKCERFDLKSKKSITSSQKYYLTDLSLYFSLATDNRINYGPVLENIIYIYAKSKGYQISVGRIGKLECDFIFRDDELQYSYVQVAMTILNSIETENREYTPLEKIKDNYPKYVITRNDLIQKRNGIRHVNIAEFIRNNSKF